MWKVWACAKCESLKGWTGSGASQRAECGDRCAVRVCVLEAVGDGDGNGEGEGDVEEGDLKTLVLP